MSRDSSFTSLHLHQPWHADLLESFTAPSSSKLPAEEIVVSQRDQPVNVEEEDDVVPDQHAAFGIQRATQGQRGPAWRDYGLQEVMNGGPPTRNGAGGQAVGGAGSVGSSAR